MSSLHQQARKLEEDGELEAASRLYAQSAFDRLNENDFETGHQMCHAVSELTEAVSSAVRSGRTQRAIGLRNVLKAVVDHREINNTSEDRCLTGLLQEWLGDTAVMVQSDDAFQSYDAAAACYETISDADQRFWGWEDEFDYAHWDFQEFLTSTGRGEEANDLPKIDFDERIDMKRELAEELVPTSD